MRPFARVVVASWTTMLLLLAGCSTISVDTGDGEECGPPRKGVQTIDEANTLPLCEGDYDGASRVPSPSDSDEIMAELLAYGLEIDTVVDHSGWASSSVCASLLGKATPQQIAPYAAKWFSKDEEPDGRLTEPQARSIVELIVSQRWCSITEPTDSPVVP